MALDKVWRKRGRKATTDASGARTFLKRWGVKFVGEEGDEPAAIAAVIALDPFAALYQPHPDWPWAVCRGHSIDEHERYKGEWGIVANYSTVPFQALAAGGGGSGSGATTGVPGSGASTPGTGQSNSTPANQRPPTITGRAIQKTKVLEKDVLTGGKVVNSVGDPFDPLPEVPRSEYLYTFTFHRSPSQLDWTNRSLFLDSINAAPFMILGREYPAFSLRCNAYDPESEWETGPSGLAFFWKLTVQVETNTEPDGWRSVILNTGRRKFVSGSPNRADWIVDAQGQPVADPVPLDGGGNPIAPGGTFAYMTYNGHLAKDWTNLLG